MVSQRLGMEDQQERIRDVLCNSYLEIEKRGSSMFLFDNIDSFVALSRENTTVEDVVFDPFDSDAGNYEDWDKVGQVVGNLMELETIHIHFEDERDEARSPNWETLTRILRYLRRKVTLCYSTEIYDAGGEEIQGFARAIHGHPMISEFTSDVGFTFANLGPWCYALTMLPSLERVKLGLREPETEEQRVLVNPESFTELLRAPALRFVKFDNFCFTEALCHAVADTLEEGSSVVDITFEYGCSFPGGGRAIIANALKTNESVTNVNFGGDYDEPFCNTLDAVLLCNSTLQNLTMHGSRRTSGRWLFSIFLALGMNAPSRIYLSGYTTSFGISCVQPLGMGSQRTQRWSDCHYLSQCRVTMTVLLRHAIHFPFSAPTRLSSL
jgi:hypothetical protein